MTDTEILAKRLDEIEHRLDCHDRALHGMWRMVEEARGYAVRVWHSATELADRLLEGAA